MSTRRRSTDDFDAEIQAHVDLEVARLIAEGVPAEDARPRAARAFGSVARVRERYYERHRLLWIDHLRQDVRVGFRAIRRYPLAAAVAILSLAGGIGATTVTLTIRDVVFHRYPPLYSQPAQLSRVQVGTPDRPAIMPIGSYVPAQLFREWRDTVGMPNAAASPGRGPRDVRVDDRLEQASLRMVTPDFFDVLGVAPAAGRFPETAAAGAARSVILSHRLWDRLFDARSDAVGRTIWIDSQPYTVAAVLPERFWFSSVNPFIWMIVDPRSLPADEALDVVFRRPNGVTPDGLDARLQGGLAAFARRLPAAQRQLRLKVSSLEGTPLGAMMAPVLPYILGASVALTLLIACANVAILMMAQWTAREHETAIRASIGASRGRIVRGLLTESVLIAGLGGILGAGATLALHAWILSRGPGDATFRLFDVSIDYGTFVQAAAISFATGILAGIAPALYETRRLHTNPLRTLAASDRVRQRWRHALVVAEITVTAALFVEASSMIAGYQRVRSADMGFSTAPMIAARAEHETGVAIDETLDALGAIPGVAAVAAGTAMPLAGAGRPQRVAADAAGSSAVRAEDALITPGFFTTLGVPVRAGRAFTPQDPATARIAIVNESLARLLFEGGSATGSRIWIEGTPHDVVGVVADYSNNPSQLLGNHPKVFRPMPRNGRVPHALFAIRAAGDPAPLVQPVRRKVRDIAPGTLVSSVFTFDQTIDAMSQEVLIGTAPLFPLVAICILLTAAGIYGVLAFAVARRSRELAVRMAMGASASDIVRLMTMQTARLAGAGLVLGVGFTFVLARIARASGGAGSIYDPPPGAFLGPIAALAALAALATWIPSRRALRIDPAAVLKAD